jgi:hypothetical protein
VSEQWQEGQDGSVRTYQERLGAPWPVWLVVVGLCGVLAVAYGYVLGDAWGVLVFLVTFVGSALLLVLTTPRVHVDDRVLRAGRARLPLRHVGRIVPLDAQRTREVRGPQADPGAHLCTRGWISTSVLVEVDDADDPHPYWLVSTRHGHDLARALAEARDRAREEAHE